MSTTFEVLKPGVTEYTGGDSVIEVAFCHNIGKGKVAIDWKNELAPLLPDETPVIALDNSSQEVDTIGDLKWLRQYGNFTSEIKP